MSEISLEKQRLKENLKRSFGDNVLYYLKFTRQQKWAQDILDGKLFMNRIQYYRDLEISGGTKGQGDCAELQSRVFNANLQFTSRGTAFSFPVRATSMSFKYPEDGNIPVFCITGLTIEDMEIGEFNDNYIELHLPYSNMDIEKLKNEFGEYVVVLSGNKFEDTLSKKLLNQDLAWVYGKVKYCPPNSFDRVQAFSECSPERFLYKDLDFKHQKEFRLALDKEIENSMIFEVGSLADGGRIFTMEEFLQLKITLNLKR